jgi:hypothetical protein
LSRVDDPLRLWDLGCRCFTGPERARDCRLGRRRCCLSRWLASRRYNDLLLLLLAISRCPGIILIVSLPRFVRRVERSENNTRRERNAGLSLAIKNPPARWCSGRCRSQPFWVLARAVSERWKAYPALLLVGWRLCAPRAVVPPGSTSARRSSAPANHRSGLRRARRIPKRIRHSPIRAPCSPLLPGPPNRPLRPRDNHSLIRRETLLQWREKSSFPEGLAPMSHGNSSW